MTSKLTPCKTCGESTQMHGTKSCDLCWTVESNLAAYAKSARGRQILRNYADERVSW